MTPAQRATAIALAAVCASAPGAAQDIGDGAGDAQTGGAWTVPPGPNFLRIPGTVDLAQSLDARAGQALFERFWTMAPSATLASDGLGPLFNARSCQSCHPRGGRARGPTAGALTDTGLVVHLSVPAPDPAASEPRDDGVARPLPDPRYGHQLQDLALPGLTPEARVEVTYHERVVPLSGGETASLRAPAYVVADPAEGPLAPGVMFSPRMAPPLIGLGLLESIPDVEILAFADPDDLDGDGISGRAQRVWSQALEAPMLGRFGWKAGHATLRDQIAQALSGDLGLSSPLYPDGWGDCRAAQAACRAAPHGNDPEQGGLEVGEAGLVLITTFLRSLAVPARRDVQDAQGHRGRDLFLASGCATCHRPAFPSPGPAFGPLPIWPYSDLLLHDMGDDLADGRPEAGASGREWRTAPLWGIGLTAQVTGPTHFLHDGRARSLLEAVLWHGGEAQAARDTVIAMPPEDRAALIRFLESL